ncbi:MAG: polyphenol oxidase family protein [Gemmatimonadota bacterium]
MNPAGSATPLRGDERATTINGIPLMRADGFEACVPGLVAGITTRSDRRVETTGGPEPLDYRLSAGAQPSSVAETYLRLAEALGFSGVAVGRQVHGAELLQVDRASRSGMCVVGTGDGLVGPPQKCLLVVTVADCVPVYLVQPETRSLALLHAGWRGIAEGILVRGIEHVTAGTAERRAALRVHMGPAICGGCYEVGPEVTRALGLEARENSNVDLREVIGRQAIDLGVPSNRVTSSSLCTRCDAEHFHSHRAAGDGAGRMAAFLGRTA